MDVLSLLKSDHDTVKELFSRFEHTTKTAYKEKQELFEQIRHELFLHSKAEEQVFYPALKAFNGDGRKLVAQAMREHKDIDELLTQISRMEPQDEEYVERVQALMEEVEYHIDGEEGQIFQFAKENCPREQLEHLATEVEQRKAALARQPAA
jgi:hemerythrin superfamily protein